MTTTTNRPLPRYRGLCGATVTVRLHSRYDNPTYAWECECGVTGAFNESTSQVLTGAPLHEARKSANQHASTCRALPASE